MTDTPSGQSGKYSDKPGSYSLVINVDKYQISPHDEIVINVYITGYGKIYGSKLSAYPSSPLIDPDNSYIEHGLQIDDNNIIWGCKSDSLPREGVTIVWGNDSASSRNTSTKFLDIAKGSSPRPIATEQPSDGNPPARFIINTKDVSLGEYKLDVVFTYFNGEKWASSRKEVPFKIAGCYERNKTLFNAIGIFIALLALLLGDMASDLLKSLFVDSPSESSALFR